MNNLTLVDVTLENVNEHGFFCVKNIKSKEFEMKKDWFEKVYEDGLRIRIRSESEEDYF